MSSLSRLAALLLVLTLAGCGQTQSSAGKFDGQDKAVADVVEDLQTAAQQRKPQDICSNVLARAFADRLKASGSDCVRELDKVVRDADDFELEVTGVTVTGATAKAKVRALQGGREATTTFSLAREDGTWRLTDFGSQR